MDRKYTPEEIKRFRSSSKVPEGFRLRQVQKLDDTELESVAGGYTEREWISSYGKEIECPHCGYNGRWNIDLIGDSDWHAVSSYRCNSCGKTFDVDGITGCLFREGELDGLLSLYGDNWRTHFY